MKMILKNKKKRDCGVVAAFNASAWCNSYKPYKSIEKIAKSCGYSPKRGIHHFQFAYLVRKLALPAKKVIPRSLEEIESKIYKGKCFVFLYTPTGFNVGHVITAFMDHTGSIKIINPDSERTSWSDFASDIYTNGMREFHVYEIPHRRMARKYDDVRTA